MSENRINQKLSQLGQEDDNGSPERATRLANNVNTMNTARQMLWDLGSHLAIVVPMDFTLDTYAETLQQAEEFLLPFVEDGTIYTHPIYLLYRWKEDYVTEGAPLYEQLIYRTKVKYTSMMNTFDFNISITPKHKEDPAYSFKNECFRVTVSSLGKVHIKSVTYQDEDYQPVVRLYENGNYMINVEDYAENCQSWEEFNSELQKGNRPALLLKTPQSEVFCPASYDFKKSSESSNSFTGSIQISYFKKVDGKPELWVETRNFDKGVGLGVSYSGFTLDKYSLSSLIKE